MHIWVCIRWKKRAWNAAITINTILTFVMTFRKTKSCTKYAKDFDVSTWKRKKFYAVAWKKIMQQLVLGYIFKVCHLCSFFLFMCIKQGYTLKNWVGGLSDEAFNPGSHPKKINKNWSTLQLPLNKRNTLFIDKMYLESFSKS